MQGPCTAVVLAPGALKNCLVRQHLPAMHACRPLPEPLPWLSTAGSMQSQQQQQQQQQQQGSLQAGQVQVVRLELPSLTREVAAQWQEQGAVVAVWDSGHHSCLAAAIRLSAVYRLPQVVLLQEV